MYQTTKEKLSLESLLGSKETKVKSAPINSYTVGDILAARAVLKKLLYDVSMNEVVSIKPVITINNES